MVSGSANESKNVTIAQRKSNKEETRDVYLFPPLFLMLMIILVSLIFIVVGGIKSFYYLLNYGLKKLEHSV